MTSTRESTNPLINQKFDEAESYLKQGNTDEARKCYKAILKIDICNTRALVRSARICESKTEQQQLMAQAKIITFTELYVQKYGSSTGVAQKAFWAQEYLTANTWNLAAANAKLAFTSSANDNDSRIVYAKAILNMPRDEKNPLDIQQTDEAISELTIAIEIAAYTKKHELIFLRAQLHKKKANESEANEDLATVLTADSEHKVFTENVRDELFAFIKKLEPALTTGITPSTPYKELGDQALNEKKWDAACHYYTYATYLEPKNIQICIQQALLALSQSNFNLSFKYIAIAMWLNSRDPRPHTNVTVQCLLLKRYIYIEKNDVENACKIQDALNQTLALFPVDHTHRKAASNNYFVNLLNKRANVLAWNNENNHEEEDDDKIMIEMMGAALRYSSSDKAAIQTLMNNFPDSRQKPTQPISAGTAKTKEDLFAEDAKESKTTKSTKKYDKKRQKKEALREKQKTRQDKAAKITAEKAPIRSANFSDTLPANTSDDDAFDSDTDDNHSPSEVTFSTPADKKDENIKNKPELAEFCDNESITAETEEEYDSSEPVEANEQDSAGVPEENETTSAESTDLPDDQEETYSETSATAEEECDLSEPVEANEQDSANVPEENETTLSESTDLPDEQEETPSETSSTIEEKYHSPRSTVSSERSSPITEKIAISPIPSPELKANTLQTEQPFLAPLEAKVLTPTDRKIKLHQFEIDFLTALKKTGAHAFIRGGTVRDRLINPEPNPKKDVDIVTTATTQQIMEAFRQYGISETFPGSGLFKCNSPDGSIPIEIWQSKIPANDPDWIIKDAQQLDFTVNALYTDEEGKVWDPTARGLNDLSKRCIKTIIDAATSFKNDAVRMLRAFYFEVTTNFRIDEEDKKVITATECIFSDEELIGLKLPEEKAVQDSQASDLADKKITFTAELTSRLNSWFRKIFMGDQAREHFNKLFSEKMLQKLFPALTNALNQYQQFAQQQLPYKHPNEQHLYLIAIAYKELENNPHRDLELLNVIAQNPLLRHQFEITPTKIKQLIAMIKSCPNLAKEAKPTTQPLLPAPTKPQEPLIYDERLGYFVPRPKLLHGNGFTYANPNPAVMFRPHHQQHGQSQPPFPRPTFRAD